MPSFPGWQEDGRVCMTRRVGRMTALVSHLNWSWGYVVVRDGISVASRWECSWGRHRAVREAEAAMRRIEDEDRNGAAQPCPCRADSDTELTEDEIEALKAECAAGLVDKYGADQLAKVLGGPYRSVNPDVRPSAAAEPSDDEIDEMARRAAVEDALTGSRSVLGPTLAVSSSDEEARVAAFLRGEGR